MVLHVEAMNTHFYVDVFPLEETEWKERFTTWIRYVEKEWSRFLPHNELTFINDAEFGAAVSLSEPLFDVLVLADYFYHQTEGLFSPYLLEAIESQGYHRSFPFTASVKQEAVTPMLIEQPLIFHKEENVISKYTREKVDLGGIAKGYAVDAASLWLKEEMGAEWGIVDGGGDLSVWSDGKKEWKIGITDPYDEQKQLTTVRIKNGALATSNKVYRSWMQAGKKKHHLLNGRSGIPAVTEIVQATAIAKTCTEADVAAKMACIIDDERRKQWLLATFPDVSFFLVRQDRSVEMVKGGS